MNYQTIENILKKINYLEAQLEIQKQILFSLPSASREEIENTIHTIAARKNDIENLRQQINEQSPEEFARIVAFEEASARFMSIGAEKKFTAVFHRHVGQECDLRLVDGTIIDCLVKARDEKGDWTIMTVDGEVVQFTCDQVLDQPASDDPGHLLRY